MLIDADIGECVAFEIVSSLSLESFEVSGEPVGEQLLGSGHVNSRVAGGHKKRSVNSQVNSSCTCCPQESDGSAKCHPPIDGIVYGQDAQSSNFGSDDIQRQARGRLSGHRSCDDEGSPRVAVCEQALSEFDPEYFCLGCGCGSCGI